MLRPPRFTTHLAYVVAVALLGCQPEIGDDCKASTDCSQTGARACDRTMPGGYCTVFNCESDTCPEEAACIAFVNARSTVTACGNSADYPQQRTFCMRRCWSDGDCRGAYICADLNEKNNDWGAALADKKHSHSKVCVVPYSAVPAVDNKSAKSDYCTASPYKDDGYYDVSEASGGSSGTESSGSTVGGGTSAGGQTSTESGSGGDTSAGGATSSVASASSGMGIGGDQSSERSGTTASSNSSTASQNP